MSLFILSHICSITFRSGDLEGHGIMVFDFVVKGFWLDVHCGRVRCPAEICADDHVGPRMEGRLLGVPR